MPSTSTSTSASSSSSKRKATDAENPSDDPASALPEPPKRQRVSRACDQCRAAREKCDGIQPQCHPCLSQNRPCTYQVSPKKRGVQTGYIRTLEIALAWLFEKVPGAEDALATLLAHEAGRGQLLLAAKEGGGNDRLHRRWRKSRIHKGIDRILSGEEVPSQMPDETPSSESTSEPEAELRCKSSAPNVPTDTPHISSSSPERLALRHQPCPPGTGHASHAGTSQLPGLPSNHWRLLDIYFSYTHSWFPIVDRQALLKTYYSCLDRGSDGKADQGSAAAHAELWSALALASFQESASSPRRAQNRKEAGDLCPHDIYHIARRLIPSEEGPFELAHVRALLLLSMVHLGGDRASVAWMLVGMATRIILDLVTQSMDEFSTGSPMLDRKSAFIACFILDTVVSVRCNKTPHLRSEDAAEVIPVPEDGLDEWQPWTPCAGFGATASTGPPSRSLSTFNQVYAIMRAVSADWRPGSTGLIARTSVSLSRLEQTLGRQLETAPPPTVAGGGSATAPQLYIVQAVYQWARGVLGGQLEGALLCVMGVIQQYSAMFSIHASPPLFTLCLTSLQAPPTRVRGRFEDSPDGRIFGSLREELKRMWARKDAEETTSAPPVTAGPGHDGRTGHGRARPIDVAAPTTYATPWNEYDSPNISACAALSSEAMYATPNSTYLATAYTRPKPAMLMTHIDTSAIVDNPTLHTPPLPHHRTRPVQARPSFSGPPLDYDAILDDLGSLDYTDRIESDQQFMANLGFAPGCDLADILTREFGAA